MADILILVPLQTLMLMCSTRTPATAIIPLSPYAFRISLSYLVYLSTVSDSQYVRLLFFFFLRREDFSRIKSLSGKVTYFRSPVFAEASIRQNGSFTHLFLAKSIRLRMLSANNFYENYNKNGKYRCSPDTQSVR